MSIPELIDNPPLPDEIREAARSGDLVLFVGAGASIPLELPSWDGLALKVLEDLRRNVFLNYSEIEQLKSLDPKKQLSIAQLIAERNRYVLNLTQYFRTTRSDEGIYRYLNEIGCVCVTTNYDELLKPRFYEAPDGSTTATRINRVVRKEEFLATHLDIPGTVVHLHGAISEPSTMVVTTREYLEHYDNEYVKEFLGDLFERKTVLFIGYRLEEAEILEHILRRGFARAGDMRRRFFLNGFFLSQNPLYRNLYEYYRCSFGVHLIGFIRDHSDYGQLEVIIETWARDIVVGRPPIADGLRLIDEIL